MGLDPAALQVLISRLTGVAEEMGAVLRRSASSPNIKERADCSAALFTAEGELLVQAEHIPVHLGSMPASVRAALDAYGDAVAPGEHVLLNDPFAGGTHLNDLTLVTPVHVDGRHRRMGGEPGPPCRRRWRGTGLHPRRCCRDRAGGPSHPADAPVRRPSRRSFWRTAARPESAKAISTPRSAPTSWACSGSRSLPLSRSTRSSTTASAACGPPSPISPTGHGRSPTSSIRPAPPPTSSARRRSSVAVTVSGDEVTFDFTGSDPQARGNVNAVEAVTVSAVAYALRTAIDPTIPANGGALRPVTVVAPAGTIVAAQPPAAVGAGNVEVSQRVADVCLGALAQALPDRVGAAGQGTMNNVLIGGAGWVYYETVAGGEGGQPTRPGQSGVHTAMTNTKNTPDRGPRAGVPAARAPLSPPTGERRCGLGAGR